MNLEHYLDWYAVMLFSSFRWIIFFVRCIDDGAKIIGWHLRRCLWLLLLVFGINSFCPLYADVFFSIYTNKPPDFVTDERRVMSSWCWWCWRWRWWNWKEPRIFSFWIDCVRLGWHRIIGVLFSENISPFLCCTLQPNRIHLITIFRI